MDGKLEGQVAIVTGAGRNIGEEIARTFAREGASVAVVDLDRARAQRVAQSIVDAGGAAAPFVANVCEPDDVDALVRGTVERFGRLDILVNNVAVTDNKHIFDITTAEWDRVIAATLTAPFLMGKAAALQMVRQGGGKVGKIVNVGSTSGYRGRGNAIAYTAAKGGVANLTKSMAVQLAPHNIRVNSVSPNRTGSPVGHDVFDPNRTVVNLRGRVGLPRDTAAVVLFVVSDDADFITGSNIFADGGVMAMEIN